MERPLGQLAVVYNPHAKLNKKHPERLERLTAIVGDGGVVYETRQLDELPRLGQELAALDIDLLCICGGDGTNQLVLTALLPAYLAAQRPIPPIYFLKGGSMNTIGWSLGLRFSAESALASLIARRRQGEQFETAPQNTLRVNDKYGMLFGNGYAINFLEEYYSANSDPGPRRAAEIAYKAISSVITRGDMFQRLARQFRAEVTLDGRRLEFPAYGMILIGTVEYIGIGFKSLYRAHEAPDRFHAVFTMLTPGKILAQLHRFYAGRPLTGECHVDELAREVIIRAEQPLGYTLDGELYSSQELNITTGPTVPVVVR